MVLVILFLLLSIAAIGGVWVFYCNDKYDIPMLTFFSVIIGGAMFGLWAGVSAIVTYNTDDLTRENIEIQELRALDTGTDERGRSYFLGGGYYESGPVYTYLVEREDGGFEMKSIPTGKAIVYQTDEGNPRVVACVVRPTSRLWSIIGLPGKKQFYVPEGSVQEPEYRVNVER